MQPLNAELHRRLLVERAAVAATLDKGNARYHRIAGQRLDVEDQRTANQSVDEQAMRGRIDIGNAVMRSLEMQAVRRDHALQRVQRRARHTGAGRSRKLRRRFARPCFRTAQVGHRARTARPPRASTARPASSARAPSGRRQRRLPRPPRHETMRGDPTTRCRRNREDHRAASAECCCAFISPVSAKPAAQTSFFGSCTTTDSSQRINSL